MARTFQQDHIYGKEQELGHYRTLKRYFGHTLKHNNDDLAPWDFEDCDTVIEMKSRHELSTEYRDTMIKTLKIDRAKTEDRDVYYIFNFIDRLCWIKYDEAQFSKYKVRLMKIKNREDYTEKWENRTFIPICDLKVLKIFRQEPLFIDF